MKCKICGQKTNGYKGLSLHLWRSHSIHNEEYYIKWLHKKKGKCLYCGKPTGFISLENGYRKFCCTACSSKSEETRYKIEQTNLKVRGCRNAGQDPKVIRKRIRNYKNKTGYDNPMHNPEVVANRDKNYFEKTGYDNPMHNPEVVANRDKNYFEKTGYSNPFSSPKVQKQIENYWMNKEGVTNAFQSKDVKKKIKEFWLSTEGVENPSQVPRIYRKIIKAKGKPITEKIFKRLLNKNNIKFKSDYYIKGTKCIHFFDFAVIKNNKVDCLIEIDGEIWHGLTQDATGKIGKNKDNLRWELVPNNVKYLVIDSARLKEGFEELLRILPMKYKDWKKEMLKSIPKNIKDALPKFNKYRMLGDWNNLCKEPYNSRAFIGKSILLNFCKSRIIEAIGSEWKSLRKTLYKSSCSSHHLLEGFDIFKNPSQLREKFRKKYKGVKEVIVKHHSPEKMLAICSLGKTYISKEPIDKESIKIINFLKLKAFNLTNIKKGK